MPKTAFIFPGQGAHKVGMGKDLVERFGSAAEVFQKANDALGFDLRRVCFEGPLEELTGTDVNQPAILTTSAAALAAAREAGAVAEPDMVGGLSLGEYTALYAAGALDFADAVRLVRVRGAAMQEAAEAVPSGMVVLVGADARIAEAVCRDAAGGEVLVPANFNSPGQVVISGTAGACHRAIRAGEARGLRCVQLPVAGAFHSPLMAPAAEKLAAALGGAQLHPPRVPVAANVTGGFHGPTAEAIRPALVAQVTGSTYWQACVEAMIARGAECFYEIGPGRTLCGMLRKIDPRVRGVPLGTAEDLEKHVG